MLPPEHERRPSLDTPLLQTIDDGFHASYHIQGSQPYANISSQRCISCMVCGKSVDEIKEQKIKEHMEQSIPQNEPAYITALRREAYTNGLNAGSRLFLASAVSQATACDGNRITTTQTGQEIGSGTLPIY